MTGPKGAIARRATGCASGAGPLRISMRWLTESRRLEANSLTIRRISPGAYAASLSRIRTGFFSQSIASASASRLARRGVVYLLIEIKSKASPRKHENTILTTEDTEDQARHAVSLRALRALR